MKRGLASVGVWFVLLLLIVLASDGIRAFLGNQIDPATGVPRMLSSSQYATRFLLEAALFSVVGIVVARYVRSVAKAGLFALSLGVAYVLYVEWGSGLWYYMAAHRSRTDQFFFTAPILAPVIFITGACLVWRAFGLEPSPHAL